QAWALCFARRDCVAQADVHERACAEIAQGRVACEQCGARVLGGVAERYVGARIAGDAEVSVGVEVIGDVRVRVYETGQQGRVAEFDDLRADGGGDVRADSGDASAFDDDQDRPSNDLPTLHVKHARGANDDPLV